MTQQQIKQGCERQYQKIKEAEERLIYLRSVCEHVEQIEGKYSYRKEFHKSSSALLCVVCGEVIRYI